MDKCMKCLGPFEYDSKAPLGNGAFGTVYKGWIKEKSSVEVAVKVISKKNMQYEDENLLLKEIEILNELTKLQHKNIVALLGCMDQPTDVFIVMEYCNGGDLQDYLNVQKCLSEDTIRLFTRQLADAMRALNAKRIAHRDLKPQNILLKFNFTTRDEKGLRIYPRPEEIMLKIADFGLARFLMDGMLASTVCGTFAYMAPEVIMRLKYDAKADLWSLGIIIYQCLLGYVPFHKKQEDLVSSFPESISPELKDLLTRLLKFDSSERISFEDFFQHQFLKKTSSPMRPKPLPSPPRELKKNYVEAQDVKKPSVLPESIKFNPLEMCGLIFTKIDFTIVCVIAIIVLLTLIFVYLVRSRKHERSLTTVTNPSGIRSF